MRDTIRKVYVLASMVLGSIIAFIVHSYIEIWFIQTLLDSDLVPIQYTIKNVFVPLSLHIVIFPIGIILGYVFGQKLYKKVYIQKKRGLFLSPIKIRK
jgi:hypothetical protein